MNRAIHPAATEQGFVGGVDDGIYRQAGDVGLLDVNHDEPGIDYRPDNQNLYQTYGNSVRSRWRNPPALRAASFRKGGKEIKQEHSPAAMATIRVVLDSSVVTDSI